MRLLEPLDYAEFIGLEADARLVITDSGGVQEETSVLGVPCLTYRTTTERPITIELGTNRLVGIDPASSARPRRRRSPPTRPPRLPRSRSGTGRPGPRAAEAIGLPGKRKSGAHFGLAAGVALGGAKAGAMNPRTAPWSSPRPSSGRCIDKPERMQGLLSSLIGRATEVKVFGREPESYLGWESREEGYTAWIEVELQESGWGTNVVVSAESGDEPHPPRQTGSRR